MTSLKQVEKEAGKGKFLTHEKVWGEL